MAMTALDYEVNHRWEQAPAGITHKDVSGVAVDSRDRVFIVTRHPDIVVVYERDGTFIASWGAGVFGNTHGITIGPDDTVWITDNRDHCVRQLSQQGELLMTLGTPGVPTDTGYHTTGKPEIHHNETVLRSAGPFNSCTNVAFGPNGDLYVADGYGNARIHRFTSAGTLVHSWGEPGTGPGQFHIPHGIWVAADGTVIVADRENDRLQFFSPDGDYLREWNDVQRPTAVVTDREGLIYVAELWRPIEKGQGSFVHGYAAVDQPGRVSVYELDGTIVARWGASQTDRDAPGNFIAPHGICVDSQGDLYVSEVTFTYGVKPKRMPETCAGHQLQKFSRRRGA
ncbi:MAG: peptidyl-alpha-hydroxyglycine alpha-amidating lyase family protein [Chloroflexota bacterium]